MTEPHPPTDVPCAANPVSLSARRFSATLHPAHGALVADLVWAGPSGRRFALLHAPAGAIPGCAEPNRFGLWPLLPFANRAFGGVMDDGVQPFALPLNDPATGSAIHGFGWQACWDVVGRTPSSITLRHDKRGGADPYRYRAEMILSFGEGFVRLGLSIRNEAGRALPYGLGLHPWLPRGPGAMLTLRAAAALVLGEGYRATGCEALAGGGPFGAGAALPADAEIAISYVGWDGTAILDDPSTGLRTVMRASETLRHPVLWTPPGADFVCIEPQSHGIGAPSEAAARQATPLARLEPGMSLAGWMTLEPSEL
jgi:aldose 1-epimerase